ncbi:ArnT family glycosyltransferase [Oceanicaulis sp. LC35]|uniref:ArnT family glycosyltransferase n=1 Tax=Oceanicaulis sp. LC35 TaxID=3349635 RepID=UPI003F8717DA
MEKIYAQPAAHRPLFILTAAILAGLLLMRVMALLADPNSLYADETQYWLWSRELDWGYFSKPPMIAWIIAATTSIFGDADWAVRLAAPFLHTLTAIMLGLSAARLFDARTGALTALGWAVMPAIWLSSTIISTDAVLMAGFSTALYALVRLREGPDWRFTLLLGAATGYAFLSKYAAIYLLIGLGISVVLDAPSRRALLSLQGAAALALFALIISGNVIWNAQHEFATVSHTAANANWGGSLFHPEELLDFLTGQLGVFGPAFFIILIWALVAACRDISLDWNAARPRLMLAGFCVPVLLIVSAQAFISRAHANWAASAYVTGIILVTAFLMQGPNWRRWVLYGSLGLHTVAGLAMMAFAASTPLSDAAGLANAFKRVRGWPETIEAVETVSREQGVSTLVYDNRNDMHQFQRYGADFDGQVFMWVRAEHAQNFAEQTWPLPDGFSAPVLIISERPEEEPLLDWDFDQFEQVEEISIPLGGDRYRTYRIFRASGYQRLERDAAYETRVAEMRADAP